MGRKRRNHFIPRMLQKHFCSRIEEDKHFIFRYARGEKCVELSTKDTGVSKDFYGDQDDILENKFARLERIHSSLLTEVLKGSFDFSQHSQSMADLVWLLAMRTEANRTMMAKTVDTAIQEMSKQLSTNEAKAALIAKTDNAIDDALREMMDHISPEQRSKIYSPEGISIIEKVKSDFINSVNSGVVGAFMEQTLSFAINDETKTSRLKHSHNKALEDHIDKGASCPANKIPNSWSILRTTEDNTFLLGDACVFARSERGIVGAFLGMQSPSEVYFPVSPTVTIVGHFGRAKDLLPPSLVIQTTVEISSRYIFSHRNALAVQQTVDSSLGKLSYLIEPTELAELAKDVWT